MTSYLDPYTLEESMREIRSSRKEIERLRTEVLDLKATIQIYVRELAELHKAQGEPVAHVDDTREGCIDWVGSIPLQGAPLYTATLKREEK